MKFVFSFFFLFIFFFSSVCFAQASKIDSLQSELKKSVGDTSEANLLNALGIEYRKIDPEQSLKHFNQALIISEKINFQKGRGNAYFGMGGVYYEQGDFDKALSFYTKSLTIRDRISDKKGAANSLNSIGNVNINQSNYESGLKSYLKSLKICESIGDIQIMPLNNIAAAYFYLGENEKALEYYLKALETFKQLGNKKLMINPSLGVGNVYTAMRKYKDALVYYKNALLLSEDTGNKSGLSKSLNNIGNVYENLHNNDTALIYYFKSLKIKEELGDKQAVAMTMVNVGNIYSLTKKYTKSLEYYEKALRKYEETENTEGIARSLFNIGTMYSKKGELESAMEYFKKGLTVSSSINSKEIMMKSNEEIAALYYKNNDYKNAYIHHKNYTTLKDSLLNETTSKNIAEIQTKYETEKKEKEIESLTKDQLLKDAKIQSQNNLRNAFIIGIVLLVLLIILTYNRYLIKQKANKEIGEKNKEITESISYAKRIQSSFLTSEKYIAQRLSDYFIYYNPRNIVSGDFYWLMEKNNNLYICTADCTGHGIPGAFMSLISMGVLNEIIYSKTHITRTDEILNELRRIIILAVNPEGATEEARDGMDAVMCRFDFDKMELEYSSANNSFFIIRNGELLVFKPDKMPVGKHVGDEKPFTRNTVTLQKGDCIYTFSDGYADQFGGPKGKKFQSKRLKELFLSHCHKPMAIQKEIYAQTLTEWKGANEQVDDILVMGIRI